MATLIGSEADYRDEAISAREAEITGKPQRIAEIEPEDLSGTARELIMRLRSAIGAPEEEEEEEEEEVVAGYFLTMVKHPDLLRCQLDMGTALFKGRLAPRERELAVLRIGWLCRAPYEWGEHVDIGKRYGITHEEIDRVVAGSDAPGWSEHDAAILRGVEELLSNQCISDDVWATLAKSWDEQQLIEFPMLVGQYVSTAFVQNSLRIRLASDNPGLTHR